MKPIYSLYIIEASQVVRNPTVDAEKSSVDEAGQRKGIEHFHHNLVRLLIVFFQTWIGYFLHSTLKLKKDVSCRHSWLPLSITTVLGWEIFSDSSKAKTSMEKLPLST